MFEVPHRGQQAQAFALGSVFTALDAAKAKLGLETYTLSQTTLEQVFLNIASRQDVEDVVSRD